MKKFRSIVRSISPFVKRPSKTDAVSAPVAVDYDSFSWDLTNVDLVSALEAFYTIHNPEKIETVPAIVEKYKDDELPMLRKLCERYQVTQETLQSFFDQVAEPTTGVEAYHWELSNVDLVLALTLFYTRFNPEKIGTVSEIVAKYEEDELILLRQLCVRYSVDERGMQKFLDSAKVSMTDSKPPATVAPPITRPAPPPPRVRDQIQQQQQLQERRDDEAKSVTVAQSRVEIVDNISEISTGSRPAAVVSGDQVVSSETRVQSARLPVRPKPPAPPLTQRTAAPPQPTYDADALARQQELEREQQRAAMVREQEDAYRRQQQLARQEQERRRQVEEEELHRRQQEQQRILQEQERLAQVRETQEREKQQQRQQQQQQRMGQQFSSQLPKPIAPLSHVGLPSLHHDGGEEGVSVEAKDSELERMKAELEATKRQLQAVTEDSKQILRLLQSKEKDIQPQPPPHQQQQPSLPPPVPQQASLPTAAEQQRAVAAYRGEPTLPPEREMQLPMQSMNAQNYPVESFPQHGKLPSSWWDCGTSVNVR
jgi:hypothetical protein